MGKVERVYVCETRPKYQGRITATELSAHGVETYLIVDGATATYAKKADLAIVGADAITSTGDLINKIGSCSLSMVFRSYSKPFISVAEALKFDPETAFGFNVNIEKRGSKEVWDKPPKRLKILNPAFDQTPARNITAYITNVGIFPPAEIEEAYEKACEELTGALEG
jgi:ribose 1,5-bisphosphate isomerase